MTRQIRKNNLLTGKLDRTFCQYRNCKKADDCDRYISKQDEKDFYSINDNKEVNIYVYLDQPECFEI